MNTSLSWIKAYVPGLDVTAQEYTDAMTLSGTCLLYTSIIYINAIKSTKNRLFVK